MSLPVFTTEVDRPLAAAARCADLGVDGVFAPDHLFPPVFYPPSGPDRPALETFTLLSAVASAHPTMSVGTLVTRVTLRDPGLLLKQAAGLDAMAASGAILGLGAGDRASVAEHEAYGIAFGSVQERLGLLEETAAAAGALFAGRPWRGGDHVPAIQGPLLPPGQPSVWVGGLSDAVVSIAARTADAWNGWGLGEDAFAERAALLGRRRRDRDVAPTWGGIALVGEDPASLDALVADRARAGRSLDGVWVGTAAEFGAFAGRLAAIGASWLVVLPVGPADRIDVIVAALDR